MLYGHLLTIHFNLAFYLEYASTIPVNIETQVTASWG
jgi:hypothetical protein